MPHLKFPARNKPTRRFIPSPGIELPVRSSEEIALRLHEMASELGIAALGFAPVSRFDKACKALHDWLGAGYHGTMQYLAAGVDRCDPRCLMHVSQTMVVAALPKAPRAIVADPARLFGQVGAYALGFDYHAVLRGKLEVLGQLLADQCNRIVEARLCVDTAPLLEREAARLAGLGFIGRSNMLIVPGIGSHVVLGVMLVDVPIVTHGQPQHSRCGNCTACIDACPTGALVSPWVLDARRCIAYLTSVLDGWVPRDLRPLMGTHVVGCDVCQRVCPFNRARLAPKLADLRDSEACLADTSIEDWLSLKSSSYRRLTRGTVLNRISRRQLTRNAAIAAGNSGQSSLVEPLRTLLSSSPYPVVRGHAAWALGRLAGVNAHDALLQARATELDLAVVEEILLTLSEKF
jgi:epoxyqueuosine reductase